MKMLNTFQKTYVDGLKKFSVEPFVFKSPDEELCFLTSELGIPKLTLDPLFRRFMSHWNDGPTLDAAYFALEALLISDPEVELPEHFVEVLRHFLKTCYLASERGFWTSPFGSTASLYGTLCGIGVMKSLGRYGCNERPGDTVEDCNEYYSRFTGDDFAKNVTDLLRARVAKSEGTLFDSKQWAIPCVISTSVASSILWNTGHDSDILLDFVDRRKLEGFLSRCVYEHQELPIQWVAFKPHPDHTKPGLSVTYHALKIINRLGLAINVDRNKIRDFVRLCWSGEGFSGTIGDSPSLISTYYALACLQDEQLCGPDDTFIQAIRPKLEKFVVSCQQQYVYSIMPKMFPTTAATRYGLQICLQQLERPGLVDASLTSAAIYRKFWKEGEGFMAYPVRLVQETSRAYGGYVLLQALIHGLALSLSPLALLRSVLLAAWGHRKI